MGFCCEMARALLCTPRGTRSMDEALRYWHYDYLLVEMPIGRYRDYEPMVEVIISSCLLNCATKKRCGYY